MRRRNQNQVSPKRQKAASLNLLDLSQQKGKRNGGLYWTMLVSMIAAYGTYMASIANMERSQGDSPDQSQSASASLALESDTEALEKADREPIEISIPNLPNTVTEDAAAPLPKLIDRLPEQESDSAAPPERPKNAVEPEPPARAELPIIVHAMTASNKVSPAARAILRRINEAADHDKPPFGPSEAEDTGPAQLAVNTAPSPPLPERRPYITTEIASQQLSSQSGTRLTRPERQTKPVPTNILAYRESVRAHLAAHRPSGGFGSGRVAVAFRLSDDGKVSSAQVIQAPEAEDLDERALNALYQAVPFPSAPDNTAEKYRAFAVSFIFE